MDHLKLLSLGAIALAVSACVVVYILHRQTTARLNALTQANLGITHTLHRLIASSMSQQQSVSNEANTVSRVDEVVQHNDSDKSEPVVVKKEMRNNSVADRIVVSDDDDDDSDDNTSDDSDEDDVDSDSAVSDDDDDNKTIELDDSISQREKSVSTVHKIVIDTMLLSNTGRFEEMSQDDDEDDDDEDDDDEDDDDEDDDNCSTDDGSCNSDHKHNNDITDNQNELGVNDDNLDIVAFLLPPTQPNNIDIGIIPINSKQKNMIPFENENLSTDGLKQMKVEELRKMAVSKLGLSDDAAKKLKKAQLIQKLQSVSQT